MGLVELDAEIAKAIADITKARRRRPLIQIRRAAEQRYERQVLSAIRAVRENVNVRRLMRALPDGPDAVIRELGIDEIFAARLRATTLRTFRDLYEASGDATVARLKRDLVGKDVDFSVSVDQFAFDVVNPFGLRFLQERGARNVTLVAEQTKTAIRTILTEGLIEGQSLFHQAEQIRELVGLTRPHARAVANLQSKLEDAGESPLKVQRAVARKTKELRRLRAMNIARTEAAEAATSGQREAWRQAEAEGLIDKEKAKRRWLTSSDPCPNICEPMDGQERGLDEPFLTGDGRSVQGPGFDLHVGCVCDVTLVP